MKPNTDLDFDISPHEKAYQDRIEKERKKEHERFLSKIYIGGEIFLWVLISWLVVAPFWLDVFVMDVPLERVISEHYIISAAANILLIFPFLFRLIFGAFPLELMRRKRTRIFVIRHINENGVEKDEDIEIEDSEIPLDYLGSKKFPGSTATDLLTFYATSSRDLSKSIYNRAGVYLLVGVIVAFSGLFFFYSQTTHLNFNNNDEFSLLAILAPKFGILFFIEMVAFFFLRQYRAAMDEFRYFEAIKRKREETLALIRIAVENEKPFDPNDLIKNDAFFSKNGVIAKDQTTEILESRKLEKNEIDLLEKVIDVISRSKK